MSLRKKIHGYYHGYIYPRIQGYRGSYRLDMLLKKLAALGIPNYEGEPKDIFERGYWDNLIILDACRYDIYKEHRPKSEKRVTNVSKTRNYLEHNFSNGDFSDIIYVAGNPHLHAGVFEDVTGRNPEGAFFAVYNVYDTHWRVKDGVPPEDVMTQAKSAEKLFLGKRKIIHFMQPHGPYLDCDLEGSELDTKKDVALGRISQEKLFECYMKNLERVMECVYELAEFMDGRTVVTADHGEFLGEAGIYGHPAGSKSYMVREVPWDVISEE